jgi:hypothetical protein
MKVPVCIRDNYVIYLEWYDGWLWAHTDVFKWSGQIKKIFLKDLTSVQSLLPLPLLVFVEEEKTQLIKFVEKLKFKKQDTKVSPEGKKAFIYAWSK